MKKIFLILFILFFIVSCKSDINEAWDIVDNYIKTLEETPSEAREVVDMINNRNVEINKIK